jgi:hypothetical protein
MMPRSPSIGSRFAIAAAASRSTLNVPTRLIPMTVRNSSRSCGLPVLSSVRDAQPTPAHDTATRSGPSAAASAIAASTCAASVTSARANVWPSSRANALPRASSRSTTTTRAPPSTRRRAVAAPSPDAAPVTSATDPSSFMMARL